MNPLKFIATLIVSALLAAPAFAQDHGSRDDAKALVGAALAHIKKVGNDQAFKDFTADKATWTKKDRVALKLFIST